MNKKQARELLVKIAAKRKYKITGEMLYELMCKIYNQIYKTKYMQTIRGSAPTEVVAYFFDEPQINNLGSISGVNINGEGLGSRTISQGLQKTLTLIKTL